MVNHINEMELVELAEYVATMVQQILSREISPYDNDTQNRAKNIMLRLDIVGHINQLLAIAIENCLVDILSCDNASWDTTPSAFIKNLENLKKHLNLE